MDELANTIQSRFHHLWRELSFANLLSNTSNSSENEEEGEDKDVASSFVNSHRTIVFNHEQKHKFKSNEISTAKYNFFTFIPKFLFEQFRRYANIFFLSIGMLQQIPGVSPTGRYVTIVPFCSILSLTALKEIVEDFKRHKADRKMNHSEVEVISPAGTRLKKWKDVCVGDIIKVQNEKYFPADLILLSSSEPAGMCYIETANLDGETNLKIRSAHSVTCGLVRPEDLTHFQGYVEAEPANRHLYEFIGNIVSSPPGGPTAKSPLGPSQVLLRGARLRNTQWIYGLVLYTGHESKLLMNSTKAPLKRSTLDKETNLQIIFLFIILLVLSLVSAIANEILKNNGEDHCVYVGGQGFHSVVDSFGWQLVTFFILYNNLIPISLQVTLELVKIFQSAYINWDEQMHYVDQEMGIDAYAQARTSNLNEELGQIKYVFSDKTGTLTMNVMEYKKCSVAGYIYALDSSDGGPDLIQNMGDGQSSPALIKDFLVLLSVCHTVIPETDTLGNIVYNAASPDEKALVEAGAKYGYEFVARKPESVTIRLFNCEEEDYQILNVIEFTSTRKRMSVIVRTPKGEIKIYVKGADNVILERLGSQAEQRLHYDTTLQHLELFAKEGLRTLCLGVATISEAEYAAWSRKMQEAATAISNREQLVELAATQIETNLTLIGATAIEDRLQEKVPETIEKLLEANIHVWMLTGDKQETAINIAKSCRLHQEAMTMIIINSTCLEEAKEEIEENLKTFRDGNVVGMANEATLVIDGKSLHFTLTKELRKPFIDLCTSCKAVICCRVSPIQKAEMVELVTEHTKAISLAIGDGANDVAMIQKAAVGVGISGNEGLQAANSADFSIAQFRFLSRLLFVHGAWNYSRISKVILYSFYKNITLYIIELWFAIYNYWSGQVLYERWTIGMYNIFFTSAPPVALGLFDRSCTDVTRETYPSLYRSSQSSELFNHRQFWKWIGVSIYHSMLLFWLPLTAMKTGVIWESGRSDDYLVLGNTVYTLVVVTTCLKAGIEMDAWTWFSHGSIWGSIILWFLFLACYSYFWPALGQAANMTGMVELLASSPVFWLCLIMIPIITLTVDVFLKAVRITVFTSETDRIRIAEISDKDVCNYVEGTRRIPTEYSSLLRNVQNRFRSKSKKKEAEHQELDEFGTKRGFAFSQEEGGAVSQTQVIRSYDTTLRSRSSSSLPRVSGNITPVSSSRHSQNPV